MSERNYYKETVDIYRKKREDHASERELRLSEIHRNIPEIAKIDEVLSMREEERADVGAAAKAFVLENKNNVAQAGRVIEFLR
jgi:hypothetical protein